MYQALYRKYRPTDFSDVCGQEHITSVLKTQLQKGRISHAYMFCGSRGTGKTTCAKILAKAVNCENPINGEPCNQCDSCRAINEERVLDVVEMDAASNNGVDHIRRLCDEVQFLPSEVKKRVYIIDEVHMLSPSAFNALLKTIEEPPSHVLFIFATTEMNDIPATIMSRCQRFDFKRIPLQVIADRLMTVCEQEGIPLHREAASVIARLSDGAMRDALSLLEACQGHEGELNSQRIHEILGLSSRASVIALCRAIADQSITECLALVRDIYDKMSDFKEVVGALIALYRDLLVIKTVKNYQDFVEGYENEIPALVEIASRLSLETILYQSKELEDFYITYDRIATGKKASAEILLIRLCNESLSRDMDAVLSRLSKLEAGGVPVAASRPVLETKAEPKRDVPSQSETVQKSEVAAKKEERSGDFTGSLKLKNHLLSISNLNPWVAHMSFRLEGSVLHIVTSPFVKGVLTSSDFKDAILGAAQKIDPSIVDVIYVETKKAPTENSNEFEGL